MSEVAEVSSVAELEVDESLILIAFASSDGEMVNQHFGSSTAFYLYGINATESVLLSEKQFSKEKRDGNEDKLKPKLAWLTGADIVYCGSCGGSATNQLIKRGVHPVVVKGGPDIEEVLTEVQQQLNGTMSPLLERIFKQKVAKDDNRFDDMADEDWDE